MQTIGYEINKKIDAQLLLRDEKILVILKILNSKISKHTKDDFIVDINDYFDIKHLTSSLNFNVSNEKLNGVKVFAHKNFLELERYEHLYNFYSTKSDFTARVAGSGNKLYKDLANLCDEFDIVPCKINYTATIDAVWSEDENQGRRLKGWIDYEEVALVPFSTDDINLAVRMKARAEIYRQISEKRGNIDHNIVEIEVDRVLSNLK